MYILYLGSRLEVKKIFLRCIVAVFCEHFPTLHVLIQVLHVPSTQQQTAQHTPSEAGTIPAGLLCLRFGIHPHPCISWTTLLQTG